MQEYNECSDSLETTREPKGHIVNFTQSEAWDRCFRYRWWEKVVARKALTFWGQYKKSQGRRLARETT